MADWRCRAVRRSGGKSNRGRWVREPISTMAIVFLDENSPGLPTTERTSWSRVMTNHLVRR